MNRKQRRQLKKQNKIVDSVKQEKPKKDSLIKKIYDEQYLKLLFIPILILILALLIIGINTYNTGEFVNKGFSLKGGVAITVSGDNIKNVNVDKISQQLQEKFSEEETYVRELSEAGIVKGFTIESSFEDQGESIKNYLYEEYPTLENNPDALSITTMGSALGDSFFMDSMKAVLIAFIFMSIVVFFIFKKYVPSMAVIICAFSDIIVTIATINLLNIKLSTAGVAALLMLIGYSVDTDILLSTRLIKEKKGTIFERIKSALRTGLTMNATTFITVLIGLIVSQSPELKQIFTILLIGLIIDIINTWIQNMSLLRLYLEKPKLSKKITYVLGLAFTNLFLLIFFYLFNWNMTIIIIALIVLDLIIILMNLFKTKNKKTTKVEENE